MSVNTNRCASLLLVVVLLLSARPAPTSPYPRPLLKAVYCHLQSDTFWIYEFLNDTAYEFRTQGHFGYHKTLGSYAVVCDTVKLFTYAAPRQPDKFYFKNNEVLIVRGDTLLWSPATGEHFCRLTVDSVCCAE